MRKDKNENILSLHDFLKIKSRIELDAYCLFIKVHILDWNQDIDKLIQELGFNCHEVYLNTNYTFLERFKTQEEAEDRIKYLEDFEKCNFYMCIYKNGEFLKENFNLEIYRYGY